MRRYRASLNGKNFRLGNEEVVGFFTTRWLKAKTPEVAEEAAIALMELMEFEKAAESFNRALLLNPANEDARVLMDECLENY